MKILIKDYSVGHVLKEIRKYENLTQTDFALKINKSRDWVAVKEIDKKRIYIDDFIFILKTLDFSVSLTSVESGTIINLREYEPNAILRFMREATGLSQTDFASTIGKKRTFQSGNETGVTRYYANDLFKLAKVNNFVIELSKK